MDIEKNCCTSCGCNHETEKEQASANSCGCGCGCGHDHATDHDHDHNKRTIIRMAIAIALFVIITVLVKLGYADTLGLQLGVSSIAVEFVLYLIPYLLAGYDVILGAFRNIGRGQVFGEDFLMTVATFGAFALVFFPESDPHMAEGAAVMLFFQVGELLQSYAVGKSRKSIREMMDIAPEYANVMRNGVLEQVDPRTVRIGDEFVVKPGERIPLDGVVVVGESQIDTAALTGESVPRTAEPGDEALSGCVNLTNALTIRASKPYESSTVSRILKLVEEATDKKTRTENFITRFARWYTPTVVAIALLLAIVPPLLLGQAWADWVQRGLVFLVVSCPCALVISVPLSFFCAIGGASRRGILIKGSNYLETLSHVNTVAFDKTGTLTTGSFTVANVEPANGYDSEKVLCVAAHAEGFSTHPIAKAIRNAYESNHGPLDLSRVENVKEAGGHGISAVIDGRPVLVGNARLMHANGIKLLERENDDTAAGALAHVAVDGEFIGRILVCDSAKPSAEKAISALREAGVTRAIMLTGDRTEAAEPIARQLGITQICANLLPQDKVAKIEELLAGQEKGKKLAFVGDGINDAPVLMRSDVGIAMGAIGSDAAIEAADIVLMDDSLSSVALAKRIARKTMRIVHQNIVFSLGVKFAVLALASLGFANLWLAILADVGVAVAAILNAMRTMRA